MTDGRESVNNAIQNTFCIWDTSLSAGDDEKELVLEYTFLPIQCVYFFYFLLLTDC
jgi:hypothetical protein